MLNRAKEATKNTPLCLSFVYNCFHPASLENVAKDYVLLGDLQSAEHWAATAVAMDEKDADAWYTLGRIRFSLQRFKEAAECFERTLVLSPRSVRAANNLGLSYEGLNRIEAAEGAYRQALAWQAQDAHRSEQPMLNLGILLMHQEHLQEAQTLLEDAASIAPRDPKVRENLGQLYLQTKQLPQARQQLEAAVALEPENASLHFLLGKVYHLLGEEEQGKSEFARAAALSGYKATPERP